MTRAASAALCATGTSWPLRAASGVCDAGAAYAGSTTAARHTALCLQTRQRGSVTRSRQSECVVEDHTEPSHKPIHTFTFQHCILTLHATPDVATSLGCRCQVAARSQSKCMCVCVCVCVCLCVCVCVCVCVSVCVCVCVCVSQQVLPLFRV